MKRPLANPIQIAAAMRAVCQEYRVHEQDILSHRKTREESEARMWFWFVLRLATGATALSIARISGHVRTSVSHASSKALVWLRVYPVMRQRYDRIVTAYNLARPDL